jgi:hypothetical protein
MGADARHTKLSLTFTTGHEYSCTSRCSRHLGRALFGRETGRRAEFSETGGVVGGKAVRPWFFLR